MGEPVVSVIICCYTEERLRDIHEAVASVLAQTLKPHEVIVAVDHNRALLEKLRTVLPGEVRFVLNEGAQGLSETRNVGIRAAGGDIVAFIDDDAVAEKDWLYHLVKPFENERVAAVGGRAIPLWLNGKRPAWFPEEFDFIIGCTDHKKLIMQKNNEVRNVTGSNMAFKKEVFARVGFWEENLGRRELGKVSFNPTGGEEAELCLRIKSKMPDSVILFIYEAVVHHKVNRRRAKLRYVFNYSLREGVTRFKVMKLTSRFTRSSLAAENLFLRRLLFTSIPQRLKSFYKPVSLAQAGVIIVNILFIGVGYFVGRYLFR